MKLTGGIKISESFIQDIRRDIATSDELFDGDKLRLCYEKHLNNCYTYALGIKFSLDRWYSFVNNPGFTQDKLGFRNIWIGNFLKTIREDLENLRLEYREIALCERIALRNDEYLIKAYLGTKNEDYHFMRYDPNRNVWIHKIGAFDPEIISVDSDNIVKDSIYGIEPDRFYNTKDDSDIIYEPRGYFAIKELKR